jgi:GNAT superfamily N-acetyltransferase
MAACPPRQLMIHTARTDDLPAIAQLLDEAGDWMRRHGITDQWPVHFPLSDLAARIDRGELHIAHDQTTPIGTFALDHHADPEFWHDDPNGDVAGYLHRLAVARSRAGKDTGAQLVEHADRRVAAAGDGDGFASLARERHPATRVPPPARASPTSAAATYTRCRPASNEAYPGLRTNSR